MVEVEKDNTRGIAIGGLTTGIIGTALSTLGGNLGGILGGGCQHGEHVVSRYEMGLQQELAEKNTRISLLESNIYVDSKISDVYERLNNKINGIEAQICQQSVVNAQVAANLSCMQRNLDVLNGLTKTIIPITNICPQPATATTAPTT